MYTEYKSHAVMYMCICVRQNQSDCVLILGFHLDVDSRDGKILVLRNKG